MDSGFLVSFIFFALIGSYIYFLPGVIAGYRKHRHRFVITLLNLLTGWTVLAWIALLVWALMYEQKSDYTKQLLNLSDLKDRGALTEEEYEEEKRKLLNKE